MKTGNGIVINQRRVTMLF